MEFSSADFMKLTVQEAADLPRMRLYGKVDDQLCEIYIEMREVVE